MRQIFNWKRFWCPRDKGFQLSDNGFLLDPDASYGKILNPDLMSFEQFCEKPCVALLGEPGIGKSWALNREKATLESSILAKGDQILWLDLRSFGSEDRLWNRLFEGEEFKRWRESSYALHVFLDSLDECLLRIDNVATLIADQLPNEPVGRLRLRIACRTAPWPRLLEHALVESFGVDGFEAYELVPLRRGDVIEAAAVSGIANTEAFITRIQALDAVSFAIKPVTLDFLIKTYLRDGDLPHNQLDLYERGCRILCQESNESRVGAAQTGGLDPAQRMAIAARIAGLTQFCNRYAIWAGSESDRPEEDISIAEIAGGGEPGTGTGGITEGMVREVLDTGLFSSRGSDRVGWAHLTYAEFLAARFCKSNNMRRQQIADLVFHPTGKAKRLIPQLRQVAGWLAVMIPGFLQLVAESEPESLIGTAGTNLSNEDRALVTKIILDQSDNGRTFNLRPELFPHYRKLRYSGLVDQLRPYLRDKKYRVATRQVAVDIVRSCELRELGSDLCDIGLDLSEQIELRVPAAAAAAELGSKADRERMRQLAFGEAGDDPDDELKGSGLTALWPGLIDASELFQQITPPKNRNLFGTYSTFLYHNLLPHLQRADLKHALEWFASQGPRTGGPIDALMDGIIKFAWEELDQAGIPALLAKAVISRTRSHDRIVSGLDRSDFQKQIMSEHQRRRKLLAEILPKVDEGEAYFLGYGGLPIIIDLDLLWLIEQVSENGTSAAKTGAKLVRRTVNPGDPEQMRALYLACERNPILQAECADLFNPIMLDSEQARLLREDLGDRAPTQPALLDPSPEQRVNRDLSEIEAGDLTRWVRLTWDLSLEPASSSYDTTSPDLTEMPGWKIAAEDTKSRIIQAAISYLKHADPKNERWFETSEIYHDAIAGFRALALLSSDRPDELANLSSESWAVWAPICIRYPHANDIKIRNRLLQEAHARAPEQVANFLLRLIDSQVNQHYFLFSVEVEVCWDETLASGLLARAKELRFTIEALKEVLALLIRHQVTDARELARSLIITPPPTPGPERDRMLAAIEALISEAEDAAWGEVWPLLKQYPAFGKEMVSSVAHATLGSQSFLKKLSEEQLGNFYGWMLSVFPPAGEPPVAGFVGPSRAAAMLRDGALEHLKKRRTFKACSAIRTIMDSLPQYTWLAFHLEDAEELARAATWEPAKPQQLLALASSNSKRLLGSSQQLLDVILESLERLSAKLHQELPAVRELWNIDKRRYWPKDENDFSNYVARFLDEDIQGRGVVINREVQIRRGAGGGTGETTDIHVDAIVPGAELGTYARLYAIVEAKGNWHAELFTAMETQLRDRYLKRSRCQSGVYLVGWFSCAKWWNGDGRKAECPSMTMEDAHLRLLGQAAQLSTGAYDIRSRVLDCTLP